MSRPSCFHVARFNWLSYRLRPGMAQRPIAFVLLSAMITLLVPGPVLALGLQTGSKRALDLTRRAEQVATGSVALLRSQHRGRGRGMPEAPVHAPGIKPPASSKADREMRASSIHLNTSTEVALESRQPMLFSGVPVDSEGAAIQGLHAQWTSSNPQTVFVSKSGQAMAGKPGVATLTARAGGISQDVQVKVIAGSMSEFGGRKKVNSHRSPKIGQNLFPAATSPAVASATSPVKAKSGLKRQHASAADRSAKAGAVARSAAPLMLPLRDPNDDPLPDNETESLYQPPNNVGAPPGKTRPGGATPSVAAEGHETGNKNFAFGLPIVDLPGRGLDVSLDLTYNSLLYNKSLDEEGTPWVTYDVDSGWPAPGFRIGYGQIESQGSFGFTLTDADGTRHALTPTSTSNLYETTDGTYLHFVGGSGSGTLIYPDGTRMTYGAAGGGFRSYPTQITDRNGNYILISYVSGVGPRISSIQDTLERFVNFNYASNGDLTSISAPSLTGQSNREVVRFFYDDISLNGSTLFSGTVVSYNVPTTTHVVKYAFFSNSVESGNPHIGYRFDYSAYGMVYQIAQYRGMTLNSGSTAVASEGTQAALTTYNYPGTPINSTTGLSDAPTYTTRTDDWAGRTASTAAIYTFSVVESTGVATVTAPDGSVTETHAIVHPNNWDHGLITDSYVDKSGSSALVHTLIDWEQGPSGQPRVAKVRSTNDDNQTKATVFTYTTYDNISESSERDFSTDGSVSTTELRRTKTTYVTSSAYTNRYMVRLPARVEVFPGGSTTPVSRIDYAYDEYGTGHASLTPRSDIIMHDPAYDPFQETVESNCHWQCVEFEHPNCIDWEWVCDYYNPYDTTTDYRGNVTTVTTYPDAASTSNAISHSSTYDIAGNLMTTQVDCCQLKSFTYSGAGSGGDHDYAYIISAASGGGGLTLTTGAEYDYNTGLLITATDESGQQTTNYYNADSLRLDYTQYPAGGVTSFDYFDGLTADHNGKYHYAVKKSMKLDAPGGTPRWVESYSYFDGRDAVARTFKSYTSADGWATQDIEQDLMGRLYRTSNPYYSTGYGYGATNSDDGFWRTTTYDHLGRPTQLTMPRGDDNKTLTTFTTAQFQGVFTTITDQSGKLRRQKKDALERVIRVDEPDASGSLGTTGSPTQATSYDYDVLDHLVHSSQPGPSSVTQHRYFKYDSLSRLIRERLPEHQVNSSYNLTDSITGNSSWTRKVDYNSAGLVTDNYDPRGVHIQFSYDGVNRLTQIAYSDSTPTVRYFYDSQTLPSGAPSLNHDYGAGRLEATTYGSSTSITGTYYSYDADGRVVTQKQVTGSTTYSLSYAYNLGGLPTSETYPSGRTLNYSYDAGGRLSQLSDATTTFASGLQYTADGAFKSESWGNGAVHTVDYNRRLQTSSIKLKQNSSASTPLQQFDYGYGTFNSSTGAVDTSKNNGQITRIVATIGSTTQWTQGFTYDSIGRLSNVAEYQGSMGTNTYQQGYTYDRWGNRFQSANSTLGLSAISSSEIDAATNRFIASGSTPTTYDASGNITTDTKFRNLKYEYDANGRQTAVKLPTNATVQTSVYDGSGLRVQTTASGVTRTMIYDVMGLQVADYNGGSLEKENIYRGGQLLSVVEAPPAAAPTALSAAPSGSSSVALSWTAASGATNYRVERKAASGSYTLAATTTSTSLTDSGVSSGNAYLYRVCAADGSGNCTSTYSNLALGAAISFATDPTIISLADDPTGATVTTVKAAHINELRTAVNAVRSLAGLAAAVWTNTTVTTGSTIYADDVRDLRTKLDEALTALGIQTSAYDDSTLAGAPSGTLIKKTHIVQLRQRSTSGSGTSGSGGGGGTVYVLTDVQGSSRAAMNNSGSGTSAIIARHDYLPFGEEIGSGIGLRSGGQGYGASDNNRKKYSLTERDNLTGLDHTWFRKYENLSGRWTSPDPLAGDIRDPQTLNRYAYVRNDPVNLMDPTGLCVALHLFLDIFVDGVQIFHIDLGIVGYSGCGSGMGNNRRRERRENAHAQQKPEPLTPDQKKALHDALKQVCMNARKEERTKNRKEGLSTRVGRAMALGCGLGGITGAIAGGVGGVILGLLVGPLDPIVGLAGVVTGGILGCAEGALVGGLGQLLVMDPIEEFWDDRKNAASDDAACEKLANEALRGQ